MNDRTKTRNSIVRRIIDGSVTIDSVKDFENLLRAFPNDPWLHRFFADLLERDKSFYAAADAYGTAAELFVEADMTMQAIVSKILEWQILGLSYQEGQDFYSSLRKAVSKNTGGQRFFIKMTYPEMIAVMSMLVIRYFPEGSMMKKFGDEENNLYFVVSGTVEETIYHRLENGGKIQKKSSKNLTENDFFGEIYPFEKEKMSQSTVETMSRVEFAKISKRRLTKIYKKYPNVKLLIHDLYQSRSKSEKERFSNTVRKTVRHQLPTQVNIKIFSDEPGKAPLDLNGFTENISLGGASVVLGANYKTDHFSSLVGKQVHIQIYLAVAFVSLSILGTAVWSKKISLEGKKSEMLGIQFEGMTDKDRRLLQGYHYGYEVEQDRIWSLWDSLIGTGAGTSVPQAAA
ncbi:MAG: cyclic nucleotide-binding domain-containing protein [Deltaproteobacteria bacterium]|nr:cyclic nucleotide-binding domain-containing protein [Deltaproteobacteria bacterium]